MQTMLNTFGSLQLWRISLLLDVSEEGANFSTSHYGFDGMLGWAIAYDDIYSIL